MQQIAQFFKVSEEQFVRDWCTATRRSADEAKKVYQNIQLPRRATKGSAGYDFFAPESFTLVPHETILIPTVPVWASVTVCSLTIRSALSTATTLRLKMKDTFSLR